MIGRMPTNRPTNQLPNLVDPEHPFAMVFYPDASGRRIALEWIRSLDVVKKQAIGHYMHQILQRLGPAVCESQAGKNLGGGLLEFRLRTKAPPSTKAVTVLIRVFFHDLGGHRLLILDGYDKGENPSANYQDLRIHQARQYLTDFRRRLLPALRADGRLP